MDKRIFGHPQQAWVITGKRHNQPPAGQKRRAEASRQFENAPVQFVGISIDRPDSVAAFAREKQVPYPLLIATPQHLSLTAPLGNTAQALPFTAIFAPDGSLHSVRLGTLNRDELAGKIRALLAKG